MANSQSKIHTLQQEILSAFAPSQDEVWINNFYFRTILPLIQQNIESDFAAIDGSGLVLIKKILPQLQSCQQFVQQALADRNTDLELTETFTSLNNLNLPSDLKLKLKHPYIHNQMLALYHKLLTAEILCYMQSQVKILEQRPEFRTQAQKYKLWAEQELNNISGMNQSYWHRILIQPIKKWAHEFKSTLSGKVRFQFTILGTLLKNPFVLDNNNLFKILENSTQLLLCSTMALFYNAYLATHTFYFTATLPLRIMFGYSDRQMSNTNNFFTALSLLVVCKLYLVPFVMVPALIATGLYLVGSLAVLGLCFNPEKNATPSLHSLKPFPPFYETLKMITTLIMPFYNTLDIFYKMSEKTQILTDKNIALTQTETAIMQQYQTGAMNETLNERKQLFIDKIKFARQFNGFLQNYWLLSNNTSESSLDMARKLRVEFFHDELMQKIESDIAAVQTEQPAPRQSASKTISIEQQDLIRKIVQLKSNPSSPWREAVSQKHGQEYTNKLLAEISTINNPITFVFGTPPSEFTEAMSALSQIPKPKC